MSSSSSAGPLRQSVRSGALLRWAAGLAIATAIAIAWLDAPLARWLGRWEPAPLWEWLLRGFEVIGGLTLPRWTYAIALGAVALATLVAPRWRGVTRAWWFCALVHVGSRLAMVELKEATGRLRPAEWLDRGGRMFFVDGGLSFPSGHVTYFLSLTLPLMVVAPRWGRPLLAIPVLVAACRVAVNAHFASDVLGAGALVCLISSGLSLLLWPSRRARGVSMTPGEAS